MFIRLTAFALLVALSACNWQKVEQNEFFHRLTQYCGQAFEGELVSNDEVDEGFRSQRIIMHVRSCSDSEIRIPLHVGDDHSRTWVVTKSGGSLMLKHDHRHEDGSADAVTMYGGTSIEASSGSRQNFPADDFTKAMFDAEGISVSNQNVWAMEVRPSHQMFAYEMSRPARFFRIEFDLSKPVETPPAPWGAE